MRLSTYQKKALELLLDKYERSKQYTEEVGRTRAIMIRPQDVYKDYDSDFADVDVERDFERDILELKKRNLIDIRSKDSRIQRIVLKIESSDEIYKLLGREKQKDIIQKQLNLYNSWIGRFDLIDDYCKNQIELLQGGKKAKYELDVAERLLKLLEFVCNNEEIILERELSIAVFGDTKVFEKEFKTRLIYILKTYGDYDEIISEIEDEKEAIQAILEEYNIYANPKYVYFKGDGEIVFDNGISYILSKDIPLALPMAKLIDVKSFTIKDSKIMTVENLASYNRITAEDCFCIYLAGYHNSAKQALIKLIFAENPGKTWLHFGDIDPDGFMILENLRHKTGIDFAPVHMSVKELQAYGNYTRALQTNDITKAKSLIDKGIFVEEVSYMLENNIKLEQEFVSWMKLV